MTQFTVKPKNVMSVAGAENSIASELGRLERDIRGISNSMGFRMAVEYNLRSRLNCAAERVGSYQNCMSSMSSALRDILNTYNSTEIRLLENDNIDNILKDKPNIKKDNELSEQEKNKVIEDFEKKYTEEARKLNEFLNSKNALELTEEDIVNIKYLVYTAEEPYRHIYLNSLSKYKIQSMNVGGGAYYRPWLHTVNYTYPDSFEEDPRGPYTTFFHECGHAIDDLSEESKWLGSDTENFKVQSDALGKKITLREAIEYDVYYNENNPHSMTSIANRVMNSEGLDGNIDNVIYALKSGNSESLNKSDNNLYNAIINQYRRENIGGEQFEAVSDVYGGMSNNKLRNGFLVVYFVVIMIIRTGKIRARHLRSFGQNIFHIIWRATMKAWRILKNFFQRLRT